MIVPTAKALAAIKSGNYGMTGIAVIAVNGSPVAQYLVEDGGVTVDRTAAVRRTCTLTLTPGTIPTSMASVLAPNGAEIWPFLQLTAASGIVQTVPMGVFPISKVTVTDSGSDVTLQVDASDRSWAVARRAFRFPYVLTDGVNLAKAIHDVINTAYPGLTYNLNTIVGTTAAVTFAEGADPWAAAQQIALAGGVELFFDVNGIVVGRPIPDPTQQASVWSFFEAANNMAKTLAHVLNADQVFNDFIVSATSPRIATPVRGEAFDASPASPTYISGPFGRIPKFSTDTVLDDAPSARAAAKNLLTASLGGVDQFTINTRPLPFLDVDDVITATRARLGLVGANFVIDHIEHSLRHDGESVITARTVTA